MELTGVLLLLAAAVCVYIWRSRHQSQPPGPWCLPIIGYLPFLDPKQPQVTLTKLARKFGPVYALYLGSVYTVVISDVKMIKSVFNKDAASGRAPLYVTHGIMKGYGLICAEGDLWKDQRRFVHNALRSLGASKIGPNRKKIQQLILHHVDDLVKHLQQFNGVSIDPLEPLRHSLGSIINLIVFGKCWSRDDETWKWLQHLQEEGTKHIGVAGPLNFLPFLRFLPTSKNTMNFLIDGKVKTHQIYKKIIQEELKQSSHAATDNLIQAFLFEKNRRTGDEAARFYNDQQFYHLLADVFGASLDTTLTTLRWYLLYLAVHKQVQSRVRLQLVQVLGHDNPPCLDDVPSLPYLEASIAEVQRIRSVVPVGIPHGNLQPIVIGGYLIPKGTMLVPLQWAVHMDPTVWENSEEYNPDRFIDEDGRFVKRSEFIPFQTGKRMCVGEELARMFLFLFSAQLVRNFDIGIEDPLNVDLTGECGITLTPKQHKLIFFKLNN